MLVVFCAVVRVDEGLGFDHERSVATRHREENLRRRVAHSDPVDTTAVFIHNKRYTNTGNSSPLEAERFDFLDHNQHPQYGKGA